ncbi:MAG TPA: D-2-hydroxyacid dehydrogenase [Verrucomicrobia bacterium]|nr:D-2-hydroxyacid dehydrogenase [Verrucomicrobiota bacterium]HOB32576.1 D-2-hydroxyacid dehydrogenase [Verrucomicrobiota bacterium]HOP97346.1 D-2-hydroxyacid dehydrogenase [Verrucomicrobiota bacterium]HPU54775.1 D-2-hydroxyacid dehydrogenase [Verrucomicrobiota bacterium]
MKAVVLDGYTLNPGDLSWDELKALGPCDIFDRTPPDEVLARAVDADAILTNKVVLSREIIQRLPRLKYIGVLATGTNVVDLEAARERNIPVTNVPGYATASVAQLTFALILELTFHVARHSDAVRSGDWTRSADFSFHLAPLVELSGLTLGLAGFGSIGRAVARIGAAFGMNVIATVRRPPAGDCSGARFVDLETLFRESDVLSLHCPLTPETHHLVNRERLALMKPGAILINTGRGPLIDEAALAEALNEGRLAGAGLDVLSTEPPDATNPLLRARNCVITPHIGWATRAARIRLMREVVENLRAFLNGNPRNVVN